MTIWFVPVDDAAAVLRVNSEVDRPMNVATVRYSSRPDSLKDDVARERPPDDTPSPQAAVIQPHERLPFHQRLGDRPPARDCYLRIGNHVHPLERRLTR